MITRDVLLLVCSHLDNRTLENLSKTILWFEIREFAQQNYFWFLRTQNLIRRNLNPEIVDWRDTYQILEEALKEQEPFSVVRTSSVTALQILLDLDYDPYDNGEDVFV